MKNKKRINIFLLLILLLGVSVGFAMLSRQLNIFGTSNIFASKWDIHWDNIANENGMIPKTAAYIKDEAKTIVEFEMNFTDPGDYYEFTVDAVNEGTMDASLLEIKAKVNDEDISTLPSYLEYTFKYADGTEPQIGDVLSKKVGNVPGRKTYKVKIYFNEETFTEEMLENMPDNGLDLVFTFSAKYRQAGVGSGAENFREDSWDTIAIEGVQAATQETTNGTCGAYNIGDTKEIDLGDLGVHTVRIANCSTPPECNTEGFSQTACGFVLEFADIITRHSMNPRYDTEGVLHRYGNGTCGGWEYSEMRAYLNNKKYLGGTSSEIDYTTTGLYKMFPEDLKNEIAPTYVVSGHDGYDPDNFTTTDKLYLLASHEIWEYDSGSTDISQIDSSYYKTRQLDYYRLLNTTTSNRDPARKPTNVQDWWWLRSARTDYSSTSFMAAWYYGAPSGGDCNGDGGVSPAFRLK